MRRIVEVGVALRNSVVSMESSPTFGAPQMITHLVSALPDGVLLEMIGPDVGITSIEYDSRDVISGAMFCCIPGATTDGEMFVDDAIAAGAVCLLTRRRLSGVDSFVTQIVVSDVRQAMGHLAARFHGDPSTRLEVVGVTGTNGKTTSCAMIAAMLEADGRRPVVIGTLSGVRTTPESPELQRLLAAAVRDGARAVVMEVSSHALELRRVDGTRFAVGVFTNFSRDHLDFHDSEESYFAAKARLFTEGFCRHGVVNMDDPRGAEIARLADCGVTPFRENDAQNVVLSMDGASFRWRDVDVSVSLPGRFNVMNAVCAATTATYLGVAPQTISTALRSLSTVRGRFQTLGSRDGVVAVVDYAHTPDGVRHVIAAARELSPSRVSVVLGCGGNRDAGKRPLMGEAASSLSDSAIFTSDNPRSEDPQTIIDEMCSGVAEFNRDRVTTIIDRGQAIATAIARAIPGEIVLVLGKGHETTQEFADSVIAFDDAEIVKRALRIREGDHQ